MTFRINKTTVDIDYFSTIVVSLLLSIDRCSVMLPALLSAFFHEIGHTAAMILMGGKARRVSLKPWGILIDCVDYKDRPINKMFILASGPLVNLILALVMYPINISFAAVNTVCGILNLLPCYGLDGGDILMTVLELKLGDVRAQKTLSIFTAIISVLLIIEGVFVIANSMNPSLVIVGLYILTMMLLTKIKSR